MNDSILSQYLTLKGQRNITAAALNHLEEALEQLEVPTLYFVKYFGYQGLEEGIQFVAETEQDCVDWVLQQGHDMNTKNPSGNAFNTGHYDPETDGDYLAGRIYSSHPKGYNKAVYEIVVAMLLRRKEGAANG